MTENPKEKFWRCGPERIQKAMEALLNVADLAGSDFEYDENELKQMLDALFDALHGTKRTLESKVNLKKPFQLKSTTKREN